MSLFLLIVQTLAGAILVVLILIQSRGTGFARGTKTSFTRRGLEKIVFRSTFIIAFVFILVSILRLLT